VFQFRVLSGQRIGELWVPQHFPVRIGRAATDDLQLQDPGVWERHVRLDFSPTEGVALIADEQALLEVNGERLQHAVLRNGDMLQLGSVILQFWLSETRQTGLRLLESLTWTVIIGAGLVQIGLLYALLRA